MSTAEPAEVVLRWRLAPGVARDHLAEVARFFGLTVVEASIAAETHLIRGVE